jgi:hypothetical protein
MNVLIDRERMVILAKHRKMNVLSCLAWLTYPNAMTTIVVCSNKVDSNLTDMELKFLCQNTTELANDDIARMTTRSTLERMVLHLVESVPEFECNEIELRNQADKIKEENMDTYCYVPGSRSPCVKPDIFSDFVKVDRKTLNFDYSSENLVHEKLSVINRSITDVKAAQTKQTVSGGRVKDTIWEVADKIFSSGQHVASVEGLKKLRAQAMLILEQEHEIKRTTSSTELGNWQKNKISNSIC